MSFAKMDIYIVGVGGQGIGLLSEVLLRAADYAGWPVRGVDTHGLSQRGGSVSSHVRIGANTHTALVQAGRADVVIALERNEALRGLHSHLANGGVLVYYDIEWQPLMVRLGQEPPLNPDVICAECCRRGIKELRVAPIKLSDPKMQNVVLLATMAKRKIIPDITAPHYEQALSDLLSGAVLFDNLTLFRNLLATPS